MCCRPAVLCEVMAGSQFWASSAADFSGALMSSDLLDCCHPLQNRETYLDRDITHCCQVTSLLTYWICLWPAVACVVEAAAEVGVREVVEERRRRCVGRERVGAAEAADGDGDRHA
jgi:hypothetical protein